MSKDFWNDEMPPGYYDKILKDGLQKSRGIQANWHNITFTKIQKLIHPNDIADMAFFLSSPKSRLVSGQVIAVDGNTEVPDPKF